MLALLCTPQVLSTLAYNRNKYHYLIIFASYIMVTDISGCPLIIIPNSHLKQNPLSKINFKTFETVPGFLSQWALVGNLLGMSMNDCLL